MKNTNKNNTFRQVMEELIVRMDDEEIDRWLKIHTPSSDNDDLSWLYDRLLLQKAHLSVQKKVAKQ